MVGDKYLRVNAWVTYGRVSKHPTLTWKISREEVHDPDSDVLLSKGFAMEDGSAFRTRDDDPGTVLAAMQFDAPLCRQ